MIVKTPVTAVPTVREYLVDRSTTEKLQQRLNDFGAKGWQASAHFTGGRDWVIVAERDKPPTASSTASPGAAGQAQQ